MSWEHHARRRTAIRSVLARAAAQTSTVLPYEELPEVTTVIAGRSKLLLALQYDWTHALWSRIELLSLERRNGALLDARELADRAYADCAERHPVLRRLLDACRDELGPSARPDEDLLRFA